MPEWHAFNLGEYRTGFRCIHEGLVVTVRPNIFEEWIVSAGPFRLAMDAFASSPGEAVDVAITELDAERFPVYAAMLAAYPARFR